MTFLTPGPSPSRSRYFLFGVVTAMERGGKRIPSSSNADPFPYRLPLSIAVRTPSKPRPAGDGEGVGGEEPSPCQQPRIQRDVFVEDAGGAESMQTLAQVGLERGLIVAEDGRGAEGGRVEVADKCVGGDGAMHQFVID